MSQRTGRAGEWLLTHIFMWGFVIHFGQPQGAKMGILD
jgi:hypothetical protein